MKLNIRLATGETSVKAELGNTEINVIDRLLSIPVRFYNEAGDMIYKHIFTVQLDSLPIPSPDDQVALISPLIIEGFDT